MEVITQSPALTQNRRMQLMLLLRTHPLLCPTCDAAGDCRLQQLVHEYEVVQLPFPVEARQFHVDNKSHFIRFDMNLCIKCGMCMRICDEVQGQYELSFIHRGITAEVTTDFGRPLDCEFCGQCAQVCPVGAICSKWLVGAGREFELKKTNTTCAFCSLGCTLTLGARGGKVVWVSSPADSHNDGNLCVKGRYGWPYVYSEERLTKPLIRKEGVLTEADWNEALSFVAERLTALKEANGPTSLAGLGSERLTNEEAYVFGRFVRTVMESPNLDHAGGFGYRGLVDGLKPTLGYPASTNSITEIRKAQVILLLGADLTETHPVAKSEVIMATARHRAKVIVVDSIRTKLADRPGMLLSTSPGLEHLVAYAMLKEIIDKGLFDKAALDLRAEGFEALQASLEPYTPEAVAALTGVAPELIRDAAKLYAEAPTAVIILTDGMNRMGLNVECAQAAANLALITGRIGREACGVYMFGEKTNSQGAIDMGLTPDLLPGFRSVTDEEARSKFEQAWQTSLPEGVGLTAGQIVSKAASGEIRGLYLVGENPIETYPDHDFTAKALSNLELLVVQDMFLTATAKMAHVVLPVVSFMEKAGTFTSAERLIQRLKPSYQKMGAKSDLEIFAALSVLMGKPEMMYASPEQVMHEIAELVPMYAGISYDRIGEQGIFWPCVDAEDPGNRVLYEGGFFGGKAQLVPAPAIPKSAQHDLPMYLVPGVLKFHSGMFSQWSSSLMTVSPEAFGEMHPEDMRDLGLKEMDKARIIGKNGASFDVRAKESRRALKGSVIVPYHFPAVKLNSLTSWEEPVIRVKVEKA
jgi:formate dehydrogenase alpha subunit